MGTLGWRDLLRYGCAICGDGSFKHSYDVCSWEGQIVPVAGPVEYQMYWWLLEEVAQDQRAMWEALEDAV